MSASQVDFVVLGASPLALLLAGLIASQHGRSVALVSETHSLFRLTRGFDCSVAPATRPETWSLLRTCVPEVRKAIGAIGAKGVLERAEPLFVAETSEGAEALMHVRHMLLAYGTPADRIVPEGAGASCHIRDALVIRRPALASAAGDWLARSGVRRVPAEGATVSFADGAVRIAHGDETIEAGLAILADDGAIAAHLATRTRNSLLRTESVTTLLTEPLKPMPVPLTVVTDRGLMLGQRKDGVVETLAAGGADALARVGDRLSRHGRARRAGQTAYTALIPRDDAPLIGTTRQAHIALVAGLGPLGAFLTPALARHFAGATTDTEAAYFAARAPGTSARQTVADYPGLLMLGAAA